jgi:hypothetical protein
MSMPGGVRGGDREESPYSISSSQPRRPDALSLAGRNSPSTKQKGNPLATAGSGIDLPVLRQAPLVTKSMR